MLGRIDYLGAQDVLDTYHGLANVVSNVQQVFLLANLFMGTV